MESCKIGPRLSRVELENPFKIGSKMKASPAVVLK
jgi:hypothetical protein